MRCVHRPIFRHAVLFGVLATALTWVAACATALEPASTRALIGDAACESDAQCATIGIGAKPCGGPASYVAWSTLRTDGARLRAAAEREAEAQRQAQAASGRVSDCAVEADPGAFCDRPQRRSPTAPGMCRLRTDAAGRPPAIR